MYIENPSLKNLLEAVKQLNPSTKEVLIFLVGEKTELNYKKLIQALNSEGVRFAGGIFPGVIYGEQHYDRGVLLRKYEAEFLLELDLDTELLLDKALKQNLVDSTFKQTAMLFLDGLSPYISRFLHRLNNDLDNVVNYIGGGAGSLSLKQGPCLFTSTGMHQDKAILCIIPRKIGLGIQHGWQAIHGPLVATKTECNIIYELNWQNAFEVYQELVEADSGKELLLENFYDLAKTYPFGISVEGEEDIVRDPILVSPEGGLVCVGDIRTNTVLYLLKGNRSNLIKSAEKAMSEALENLEANQVKEFLIIECISRVLFLEEEFNEELKVFSNKLLEELPLMKGVLTLGEISFSGMKQLRFYNKTTVIGALG